ncbi:MAG: TolB family protein [Acidobacteriota bacterium]
MPPFYLALTFGDSTWVVQQDLQSRWTVTPSLSADGGLVASAHPVSGASAQSGSLVVSLWSRSDRRRADVDAFQIEGGAVALSPDGGRVACVTGYRTNAPSRLEVFDRKTGKVVQGPEVYERAGTDISWAPDSRHLAFDMGSNGAPVKANPSPLRVIYVMDTDTGTMRRIAKGVAPAWAPSGEWIAYLDYVPDNDDADSGFAAERPNRVIVMHPDGSGARVLVTWPREEGLMTAPVWSPDSRAILINRWHDRDKGAVNVDRIDAGTGTMSRLFRNVPPVYAWLKNATGE